MQNGKRKGHTYGNGFATGSLRRRRVESVPASQEIFDIGSVGVHDAKAGDVDGTILDRSPRSPIGRPLSDYTRKQRVCTAT